MARRKRNDGAPAPAGQVADYRHAEKRKNIPPAGLAAQGRVQEVPKARYSYDPHLPPVLRFDPTGAEDRLPELLEAARQRPLTEDEARLLADALRNHQPWLEWAGKREQRYFEVDPVALHIHERVSAQAIIKMAQREPLQRSLFADPELEYREAVRFYQHDMDWANRLILGDSLVVMNSLAKREDLAGKVQMIYIDPPYGIKYSSNFQPEVRRRDVKDREEDLTREPEQVKAYRDTWTLGVHSYLAYLRERLYAAKELLADTGSVFVQISDANLHRLRALMDEVFGAENFCSTINFRSMQPLSSDGLDNVYDYVLWYAKCKPMRVFHPLYLPKPLQESGEFRYIDTSPIPGGHTALTPQQEELLARDSAGSAIEVFRRSDLVSSGYTPSCIFEVEFQGAKVSPRGGKSWRTNKEGMQRLISANRIMRIGTSLYYKLHYRDFAYLRLSNGWHDTMGGFSVTKLFAVQTSPKVIERCMLMTTKPGDLVLDPTCGSGTTAYVAEQWGRRWIAIDTSRVAIALARQRLLTAKYDYYELAEPAKGLSGGFVYKTVPHITLRSVAQNQALDPIFAKWEPVLAAKLAALNGALAGVTPELRTRLRAKLAEKERREGRSAITDADRRRWLLPEKAWQEWEVPFDTDPDWPAPLQAALQEYRQAWRQKMDEVDACIAASAPQETLVDQPKVVPGVLRVSGPFTVEGVQPVEEMLDLESPIGGAPEELETFGAPAAEPANAEAYLEKMVRLLRQDGVRFPGNKVLKFARLEPLLHSVLHAEGEWGNGEPAPGDAKGLRRVAVAFGPQYGPITAKQVEECIREAYRRGYDDLVFAGFTIDGAAQAIIQEDPNPQLRCHLAHIRPDVNMGDLLKTTPGSQLFTVFGLPRVRLEQTKEGEWVVEMEGVDIYDPITNTICATNADKVAAWFLDGDYDGRTFCITQAFFPDADAWDKLARALKTVVDPERFAAFSGTRSLPFQAGPHRRAAVKVIDPRGNEVMRVLTLGEGGGYE